MIGPTVVLLLVAAVGVALVTHRPTRAGASDIGRTVHEHLYGPTPEPEEKTESSTQAESTDNGFDYSIYAINDEDI